MLHQKCCYILKIFVTEHFLGLLTLVLTLLLLKINQTYLQASTFPRKKKGNDILLLLPSYKDWICFLSTM